MKNKLIYLLLSLLGFSTTACDDENGLINGSNYVCMYGSPSVTFSVKGRVTDPAGNPIEGISVNADRAWPRTETDAQGKFVFDKARLGSFGDSPLKIPLQFEDVDGPKNGSFKNREVEVTFTRNEAVKTDTWYFGDYTAADIEVVMEAAPEPQPETQE